MLVFKLPHKWWHFFFSRWFKTRTWGNYGYAEVSFYCSKCKKIFEIDINEVGEITEINQRDPR